MCVGRVAEAPTILSVHGSAVLTGSSVNLTCVVRAEPPPEVTWYGPNKTLPYSSSRTTNSVRGVGKEEGVGVWECVCVGGVGDVRGRWARGVEAGAGS